MTKKAKDLRIGDRPCTSMGLAGSAVEKLLPNEATVTVKLENGNYISYWNDEELEVK